MSNIDKETEWGSMSDDLKKIKSVGTSNTTKKEISKIEIKNAIEKESSEYEWEEI